MPFFPDYKSISATDGPCVRLLSKYTFRFQIRRVHSCFWISIAKTEHWAVLSAYLFGGAARRKSLRNNGRNMCLRGCAHRQASTLGVAARGLRIPRGMRLDDC